METFRPEEVIFVGDFLSERRDTLSILWAITKGCNYKCSYCVYTKELKNTVFSSRGELLKAARTILRLGRPGYQLTLYGGEPTQHPHFLDLLAYIVASDAPVSLRMYTNGSRSLRFFQKMIDVTGNYPFGVIFSFHAEYADFERFRRVVELTAAAGLSVGISFMFHPAHGEAARQQLDTLLALRAKHPFFMMLNYPYTPNGAMGTGCSEDDITWIKATRAAFNALPMPDHLSSPFYTRILSNVIVQRGGQRKALPREDSLQFLAEMNTPSFKGFHCCSGANVIFVEEDGAVRGGVCSASQPMGNIFRDSEFSLVQNMNVVCCTANACASIENVPLPKFRDRAEAEACLADFRQRAKSNLFRAEAARLKQREA